MTTKPNKATEQARLQNLLAGTQKHLPVGTTLALGGTSYTPAQIGQLLQSFLDLFASVTAADAARTAKVKALREQGPPLRKVAAALVAFVRVTYGNAPDVLADFGLEPRKARTPSTVQTKVATVDKVLATRKARHTMGSKQKAAIKGNVTGVTVTPITAPTGSAASPAQAPAGR